MLVPDVTTASAWVANPKVGGSNPPRNQSFNPLASSRPKRKGPRSPFAISPPSTKASSSPNLCCGRGRRSVALALLGGGADDGCPRCSGVVGFNLAHVACRSRCGAAGFAAALDL